MTSATAEPGPRSTAQGHPDTRTLNAWIEIRADHYRHNLDFVRRRIGPRVELSAVVKSNAYGHGLELIAGLAARSGADSFCVHSLEEAQALRTAGFSQDVLIMGYVPFERLDDVVQNGFRLVLYDLEVARRLDEITRRLDRAVRVHVKVETGTHRQGLEGAPLRHLLDFLAQRPRLDVEGVYTHFADIEDTTDHGYARRQLGRFRAALEDFEARGLAPRRRHAACSAAALLFPETHFDMVRLGISQYGFWSSKETHLSFEHAHGEGDGPLPVLSFKARISQIKNIEADAYVGYGRTWQATRPTRLAILPIGYADGYDRLLSNRAHVLVHGRRAPVRGRVCMNLTLLDVTDIPQARVGDEAVLIGTSGERRIGAEQLAELSGTIPYEIVARLAAHLPRILV